MLLTDFKKEVSVRICEKCGTEYEKGHFYMQYGSDFKEKKSGGGDV